LHGAGRCGYAAFLIAKATYQVDLLQGLLLGLFLLGSSALFWRALQLRLPARYCYPLWLSVPLHQLLTLSLIWLLGVTPAQGWFGYTLLALLCTAVLGLLLVPVFVFARYAQRCQPLREKI
jgi:hypothetical protein